MQSFISLVFGKAAALLIKLIGKGNGSTWPGHIALKLNKNFLKNTLSNSNVKIIIIIGTNGKTTTSKMISTILQKNGKKIIQNSSGANLLNGIASEILRNCDLSGKLSAEYAIFETDEYTFPLFINYVNPFAVIALNLFRDQLDRYGELDSIGSKWKIAIDNLPEDTILILNADDPLIAYLGGGRKNTFYFGLEEQGSKIVQHASDSIYCPRCNHKLEFRKYYFSHLGLWHCNNCLLKRPVPNISDFIFPLPGIYNKYNTLAAVLLAKQTGISDSEIKSSLQSIEPAFGRQELININGKKVQIFLSKNPTSFNQSLQTVIELKSGNLNTVLLVLNDRIPDGRDISWIWDIDFENYLQKFEQVIVSGDRAYDLGLRLQYSFLKQSGITKVKIFEKLDDAIKYSLTSLKIGETLFVLPTYSAMLEVRNILTGRKIL